MSRAAILLEEAVAARRTGALVVGDRQAVVYLLLGEPHHASVPGTTISGLDAVRAAGRLEADGVAMAWRSDEPLGAGRSLVGQGPTEVVAALRAGTATAAVQVETLVDDLCLMVDGTLHRHGARVVTGLRTAASSAADLRLAASELGSQTIRGVSRQTLQDLSRRLLERLDHYRSDEAP